MTYSEDLINDTQVGDSTYLDDQPSYPSIFGIDLSPMLVGAVLAVVGLGGSGYLAYSNVMPQFQANQESQTKLANVQQQIQDRQDMAKKIATAEENLKKADTRRESVLSLFANEQKLDTLLIDINKLVVDRQGQLQSFKPDPALTGPISDSSLGAALNGKLRRKSTGIEIKGGFEQMQSILRTVERMDQLLILQDFKADLQVDTNSLLGQAKAPSIKTNFKLQAIIPLAESKLVSASAKANTNDKPPVPSSKTSKTEEKQKIGEQVEKDQGKQNPPNMEKVKN
jgi:type IV pilus assembly protein PilO